MGNSQPTNRTGKKVTAQKFENAKKLGVLSLSEHGLQEIPSEIYNTTELRKLRTIDLSKNNIRSIDSRISYLTELKSLNLDDNDLYAGSLIVADNDGIGKLNKLQNLSLANNKLGKSAPPPMMTPKSQLLMNNPLVQQVQQHQNQQQPAGHGSSSAGPLPSELPSSLKQINLCSNYLMNVPKPLCSSQLIKLEKIDLSSNELAAIPPSISNLSNLKDLNLDANLIVSLPEEMGQLKQLKALSLRHNKLRIASTVFTEKNPQPIPKSVFADTLLIDLNLHGNHMTNTQMNQFDGYQEFLDRRQKVKSKTLSNLDVCGLK